MAAKGGKVLGVLAIIIAIGALGFELYNIYLAPSLESEKEIGGTWYNSEPDFFSAYPDETFVFFNDLSILFNLNTGESVYISYNGLIFLTVATPLSGFLTLDIYFSLDGVRLESPNIKTEYDHDGFTDQLLPASLQYFNSTLPAGNHNITIVLWGIVVEGVFETKYNGVRESTLFVQTYSS